MRLHGEALKQRSVVGRLHQHHVGVELPRLVKLELDDGTRAIRKRKLAKRTSDTGTECVFAGALWAGSTIKNVGVEPPRRVQHEFVGVREVGISTLLAAI